MHQFYRFSFALLSVVIFSGCTVNYSFTGASISPDINTFEVQYFENRAPLAQPTLSQEFTESLKDRLLRQTRLSLTKSEGDLIFEGYIAEYRNDPVTIQSNDQAAQNRLTITVMVKFTNVKEPEKSFEQRFSKFANYDASQSLSSVESLLIEEINGYLTQDIFNAALSDW